MTALKTALLAEDKELAASFAANRPKRELAMALRALRRRAGLTQQQVAERSGLTQSHISKLESATGPMPTTASLNRYARACGSEMRVTFVPEGSTARQPASDDKERISALF